MPKDRPDPDELLRRVVEEQARQQRGKLTLFFGAAPGVGKTYAMLEAARAAATEGRLVLVGIVETHGRFETAALLNGLEVLPRRKVTYRGFEVEEFDLDAALARHPRRSWSTSWRTPTPRARATPSAGKTSRSCWRPASTSSPR